MKGFPESIRQAMNSFQKLPGVGQKSAERLVFALLKRRREDALTLAQAIENMMDRVSYCRDCRNYAETPVCSICNDTGRVRDLMCVVEQPEDVWAIERTGEYRGRYFVLHGSISPLDGVGPEELGLDDLVRLVTEQEIREIILATNPNVSGEATAIYIARKLVGLNIQVSRIALGIPAGGNIGYADEVTMLRALEGRTRINLE